MTIGPTSGDMANLQTTGNLYSGKLTWHVNDSNTVIGSVFGDPTNDSGAVGQLIGPPTTYHGTVDVGGTDWGLRYEGIFGANWLVTAQGGVHTENTNQLPGIGGNTIAYQDTTGDARHRLRRVRRHGRQRAVGGEEVHARLGGGDRQLPVRESRHQGGSATGRR